MGKYIMSTTSIMMIYLSKPFFSQIETNSLSTLFNLILPNIGQTMRLFNWKIYRWNRYKLNNGKTNWVQFLVWWWTHQKHIIIWINNNSLTTLFTVIVSKSFENAANHLKSLIGEINTIWYQTIKQKQNIVSTIYLMMM